MDREVFYGVFVSGLIDMLEKAEQEEKGINGRSGYESGRVNGLNDAISFLMRKFSEECL